MIIGHVGFFRFVCTDTIRLLLLPIRSNFGCRHLLTLYRGSLHKEIPYRSLRMDSIKAKLEKEKQNPEDAAKMDAEIRENKRSVGARAMVEAVKSAQAQGLSKEEIEKKLAKEKEEYPRLFAMVLDPRHSPAMLYAMLAQLESVEQGRRSTHDASVAVGTILVNSFVRPKLGMDPVPLPSSSKPPARR